MNSKNDLKLPPKCIMASFIPQARVNDNAIEIDGRRDVDVTDKVLALSALEIGNLTDFYYTTDNLVDPEELGHDGPFAVEVELNVCDFFGVANLSSDITDEMVAAARAARGLSIDGKHLPPMFRIRNFGNDVECADLSALSVAIQRYYGKSVSIVDLRNGGTTLYVDVSDTGDLTESYGQHGKVDIASRFGGKLPEMDPNHAEVAAEFVRLQAVAPHWKPAMLRESAVDTFSMRWGMAKDEIAEIVDSYVAASQRKVPTA